MTEKPKKELDPLDEQRLSLLDMGEPFFDVLYYVSDGFELPHACLIAKVKQPEFEDWAEQPNNQEFLAKARRLGIAKYTHSLRLVSLGVSTRRSQTPAMKFSLQRLGAKTSGSDKIPRSDGRNLSPNNSSTDLSDDVTSLEKQAGYATTEDSDA